MFSCGGGPNVFLATGAIDLRRSFGLSVIVENELGYEDALNGDVFVFANKKRDLAKLFWFADGAKHVLAVRLEEGTFAWPKAGDKTVALTHAQLHLLLGGIDLMKTRSRKRWQPASAD